ncbi:DUF4190 domain-containing protein [Streptomyces sp. G-G2]|uniref:DUF4190 domain-containing protein n=1 Tax=Streptomyces sp. G-G2 TaxID=3046201 RepID=UPI0024B94581|nr:DUF4190 domain-containing protein [Streptomyces sp. G-G2]MDJ0382991.1 DUF4190 domain-containing protein [Streptomyces sp. G-G2]
MDLSKPSNPSEPEDAPTSAPAPAPAPEPTSGPTPESTIAPAPTPTVTTPPTPAPSPFAPPSPSPFGPPTAGGPAGSGIPGRQPQPQSPPQPPANPWGQPPGGYAQFPYPGTPQAPSSNGMAIAALVLGVISVPVGFIPFFFWAGALLALVAIGLGIAGMVQGSRGAPYKALAISGTVLGVLGLCAAGVGAFLTVKIAKGIDDQANKGLPPSRSEPWSRPRTDPSPGPSTKPDVPGKTSALPFGQTYRYDDGVEVTVKEATGYAPEPNKYDPDRPTFAAKVTVTIVNNASEKVELRSALPSARDEKGLESKRMYDVRVEKPFSGSLLPGQSATAVFAFGLSEGAKGIQFEIAPNIGEYEGAIWSGTLG